MNKLDKATAGPDNLASYQVSCSDRWYDMDDIEVTYDQGMRHGMVLGVLYTLIVVACAGAITVLLV